MSRMWCRCATLMVIVALAACSNGSGSLNEAPPPTAGGQVESPTTPAPTPAPTPSPAPTPEPTPTPSPAPAPEPNPTPTPTPTPVPTPTPTPTAPASALAGFWQGTLQSKSSPFSARALVGGNGDLQLIVTQSGGLTAAPEFVVFGNVCCESTVNADLQSTRYLSERVNEAKFEAERSGGAMTGKLKIRGDDYEFSLDRSARYDESLTLADLAGTYTRTVTMFLGPSSTYTITLDPTGQLTGSHSNGCVYNGAVSLPDAPRNLIEIDVELSNCPSSITGSGSMNGTYAGLGVLLRDAISPNDSTKRADVLFHSLIGRTWLGPQPVEK